MGCPAEGAVWAHPPLISSLYFGLKLVLTCLQWFPTLKEPGHRGLKEGECGCLSFTIGGYEGSCGFLLPLSGDTLAPILSGVWEEVAWLAVPGPTQGPPTQQNWR